MRVQRGEQRRRRQSDKAGQPRLGIAGIGRHERRTNAADPGNDQNNQEQGHRGASLTDKRPIPVRYRHIPQIYFTGGSGACATPQNPGNGAAIQDQAPSSAGATPASSLHPPPQAQLRQEWRRQPKNHVIQQCTMTIYQA